MASTQDPLPVGKRPHSQSIRTLPSTYNEQLTLNTASKDKNLTNRRKRKYCPYDTSKVSQLSRILRKPFDQRFVQESTSGNAQIITKATYNCHLNQTQDLSNFIHAIRRCPSMPLDKNTATTRISVRDERILKRLAPNGCNTLTRRPQNRRRALP
jgi:hypothetical protein